MLRVIIHNLQNKTIIVEKKQENLLDILHSATDWMFACGKKGRCTTCTGIIISGNEFLTEKTDFEKKCFKNGKLAKNERLMCQTNLLGEETGEVTVAVPDKYQLPHLKYDK